MIRIQDSISVRLSRRIFHECILIERTKSGTFRLLPADLFHTRTASTTTTYFITTSSKPLDDDDSLMLKDKVI